MVWTPVVRRPWRLMWGGDLSLLAGAFGSGGGAGLGGDAVAVLGRAGQEPEQRRAVVLLPEVGDGDGVFTLTHHLKLDREVTVTALAGALAHRGAEGLAQQGFPFQAILAAQFLKVVQALGLEQNGRQHPFGVYEQDGQPDLQRVAVKLALIDLGADDLQVQFAAAHGRGPDLELSRLAVGTPLPDGVRHDVSFRQADFVQGDFNGLGYCVHCHVLDDVDGAVRFNKGPAVLIAFSTQSAVFPHFLMANSCSFWIELFGSVFITRPCPLLRFCRRFCFSACCFCHDFTRQCRTLGLIQQGRNIQEDKSNPRFIVTRRVVKFFYLAAECNAAYQWTFVPFKENQRGVFLAAQFDFGVVRIHVPALLW